MNNSEVSSRGAGRTVDSARQAEQLQLLADITRELSAILDPGQLVERVAQRIDRLVNYQLFTVLRWDDSAERLEEVFTRRQQGCCSLKSGLTLGQGLTGTAAAERRPVRVGDVREDPRYLDGGEPRVRSELALPLEASGRLIGVLDLESFQPDAFDAADEQLLRTLAPAIAIALDNASLYERAHRSEQRLAADLETAAELQRYLLPRRTPWLPGLEASAAYSPARHLGGDLYDFLSLPQGRMAVVVGDVAGKGTAAALYGAMVIGMLRGLLADADYSPCDVLGRLNEELRQVIAGKRFIALTMAVYDPHSHQLSIASSGLPYPLRVRGREIEEVPVSGLPLGAMAGVEYRQDSFELGIGETVVFTSDGIEEGRSATGEPFGAERLEEVVRQHTMASARDLADNILAATERHLGAGGEATDDRTVVVLRRTTD